MGLQVLIAKGWLGLHRCRSLESEQKVLALKLVVKPAARNSQMVWVIATGNTALSCMRSQVGLTDTSKKWPGSHSWRDWKGKTQGSY